MVLQAKLERRQRRQSEQSCHINEEPRNMLSSKHCMRTGHPQSIPPPSEPVLPAGNKVVLADVANGSTSAEMAHEAVHLSGETPPDTHTQQSPPWFVEDKSEAKHIAANPKSEFE